MPEVVEERVDSDPAADRPGSAPSFVLAATVAVCVFLVAAALLALPWLDGRQKSMVAELLLVGCPLAAMTCCLYTGWTIKGRGRATWLLLGAASAAWAAGNAVGLHVENVAGRPSLVSDALHLLAVPLAIVGIAATPTDTRPQVGDRLRVVISSLLIIMSVLFVSHQLVLAEVFAELGPGLDPALLRARLLGDVLLVTIGIFLAGDVSKGLRARLLLTVGLLAYGIGDAAYAVLKARDLYSPGTPWDLAWIGAYLLIGLAALAPRDPSKGDGTRDTDGITLLGASLVHLCLLVAIAVAGYTSVDSWGEVALGAPLLVLFGLRQTVIAADNRALRKDLESRVAGRVAELSRLAQRHQRILDAVGEGIYGVDSHGMITFVNPAAEQQLGRPAAELVGQEAHATFHAVDAEAEGCQLRPVLEDGELIRRSDLTYLRRDGSSFPVELTAAPKQDATGKRGAVVIFSDISERRDLERMKNEFVSVVSHELRTPLTAIRGSLGLLAGGAVGPLPGAADRMVRIAVDSCDRLTRLINDLLDMERLESGALRMEFQPVSCSKLVTTTLTPLQAVAEAAGVRLVTGPVAGRVNADSDRIVQALTNLVGNAVKFSPPGTAVTVTAQSQGAHVLFRVVDTGRGIPADMLERVFDRFQQVDSSSSREKGGTGLGLAITKTIVERHGCRIWVESELGKGSVFQFTLPAVPEPEPEPASPAADARTVLVCEEDPAMRTSLAGALSKLGYRTTTVPDGAQAVSAAIASRPDVILLDLLTQAGWQTLQELKAEPQTRDIPIVLMSGQGPVPDPRLLDPGVGWLSKPVLPEQAGEVLAQVLQLEKARPAVLVVEDDEELAAILVTMFTRHGLRAYSSATQREAVALCRELQPDVLVLDLALPDGDGFGVVDELRHDGRLRSVPVIVYSAYELDSSSRDRLRLGETMFMTKTRESAEELASQVVQVIERVAGTGTPVPATTEGIGRL